MKKIFIPLIIATLTHYVYAADAAKKGRAVPTPTTPRIEPIATDNAPADRLKSGANEPESYGRRLASGDNEEDINHYHSLNRRLGVDFGMMVPFGDFSGDFSTAPLFGIHFTWEAIPPFGFNVGMIRSSSPNKTDPAGKLSVTSINIGTQASFPSKRFVPFVKLEGALYFNDVTFPTGRTVTGGNDSTLTTLGMNIGIGGDFVIGREVSLGLEADYHWAISKTIKTSTGADFNLGSSFATIGLRLNF